MAARGGWSSRTATLSIHHLIQATNIVVVVCFVIIIITVVGHRSNDNCVSVSTLKQLLFVSFLVSNLQTLLLFGYRRLHLLEPLRRTDCCDKKKVMLL